MKRMVCGLLAVTLLLGGCAAKATENTEAGTALPAATQEERGQPDDTLPTADDNGMWSVELLFAETAETLAGTQAVVQYSGEVQTVEVADSPGPGNVFLLLELLVEKLQNGSAAFLWDNAYVEDENGNRYSRHENDTFLESYNLPRLKSVELKIGANRGFACYEIPEAASTGDLWFIYDGAEGEIRVKIAL